MAMHEDLALPQLSFTYWGNEPGTQETIAALQVRAVREWQAQQRQREEANAVANLARDAILAGEVRLADLVGFLTQAPPPALSFGGKLRAAWRIISQRS